MGQTDIVSGEDSVQASVREVSVHQDPPAAGDTNEFDVTCSVEMKVLSDVLSGTNDSLPGDVPSSSASNQPVEHSGGSDDDRTGLYSAETEAHLDAIMEMCGKTEESPASGLYNFVY
jgi:hypothetical protein